MAFKRFAQIANSHFQSGSIELFGYQGLLKGDLFQFPSINDIDVNQLFDFGGSLLGNSRVKLTNTDDCVRRGLVSEGDLPLEIAAKQLQKDISDDLDRQPQDKDVKSRPGTQPKKYYKKMSKGEPKEGLPPEILNQLKYMYKRKQNLTTLAEYYKNQ